MTDIHLHLPADFTAGETERVLRSLPDRYTPKLLGAEPDRVITQEAWEDAKRGPWTLGGDVEINSALEERWDRARRAYGLPDDGIAAWSLTLRETEGGWEAEAWRSDTTTTNAVGQTAGAALEALAARSGPARRVGLEERLAQLQQHVMTAAVAAAQRDGKADAIAGVRAIFQGRREAVSMEELEEYLDNVEVQLGLEPEQP